MVLLNILNYMILCLLFYSVSNSKFILGFQVYLLYFNVYLQNSITYLLYFINRKMPLFNEIQLRSSFQKHKRVNQTGVVRPILPDNPQLLVRIEATN